MSYRHRAALVEAVRNGPHCGLWPLFQRMTEEDLVLAGTSLGPARLRTLLLQYADRPPAQSAGDGSAVDARTALSAVLAVAFEDRRFLSAANSSPQLSRLRVTVTEIRLRRALAPQLDLGEDLTHTLPVPSGTKAALNDENYKSVAQRRGVSVAAIKAVARVESGGRSGFDEHNRPKILFEAHHFRTHTHGRFDLSHPHLSCGPAAAKNFYSWDQYQRLFEAMVLSPVAAIKAASWGKFQILGSNHDGWPDPVSFALAMYESEYNQLKSFEAFCVKRGLMRHLRDKAWDKFALGYNGKKFKDNDYDAKIARAYKDYGGT